MMHSLNLLRHRTPLKPQRQYLISLLGTRVLLNIIQENLCYTFIFEWKTVISTQFEIYTIYFLQ
jgi:hypothetical protein